MWTGLRHAFLRRFAIEHTFRLLNRPSAGCLPEDPHLAGGGPLDLDDPRDRSTDGTRGWWDYQQWEASRRSTISSAPTRSGCDLCSTSPTPTAGVYLAHGASDDARSSPSRVRCRISSSLNSAITARICRNVFENGLRQSMTCSPR